MTTIVSCLAIIAVRNEALHLRRVLVDLIGQGIEVAVVDHDSSDETRDICNEYLGKGLLSIQHLQWNGVFNLTEQLQTKANIAKECSHEWILHIDADEWLQSPRQNETLLQGISRHAASGYDVINFEEFVFLPVDQESAEYGNYQEEVTYYYLFSPKFPRLMRAWKNNGQLTNVFSGGHLLDGGKYRLAPENFILRHYVFLSLEQARIKYVDRRFPIEEIEKGWHYNRINLSLDLFQMPGKEQLKKLSRWDSVDFDRSDPRKKHFWER